jgi:hypothetical protein
MVFRYGLADPQEQKDDWLAVALTRGRRALIIAIVLL